MASCPRAPDTCSEMLRHDCASEHADITRRIAGIDIPDGRMAREITELIRDTESELLHRHSSRVYVCGANGSAPALKYAPELRYVVAMFTTSDERRPTVTHSFAKRHAAVLAVSLRQLDSRQPLPSSRHGY